MNAGRLFLYFGIFWLGLAALLLGMEWFVGPSTYRLPLGPNGVSMGWPALFLAVYNLLRWWLARPRRPVPNRLEEARQRRTPRDPNQPSAEPDPNFIFTDVPPAPPNPPDRAG